MSPINCHLKCRHERHQLQNGKGFRGGFQKLKSLKASKKNYWERILKGVLRTCIKLHHSSHDPPTQSRDLKCSYRQAQHILGIFGAVVQKPGKCHPTPEEGDRPKFSQCYLQSSSHQPSTGDKVFLSYLPPPATTLVAQDNVMYKARFEEGVVFMDREVPPDLTSDPPGADYLLVFVDICDPQEDYVMLGDFPESSPEIGVGWGEELVP